MKLSTKGRYGVMAMFQLSTNYGGDPVSLKTISRNTGISEAYLEQLFATLRKNGLIESARGASGGYRLAQEPDSISVGDIINVLEGAPVFAECVTDGASSCDISDRCVLFSVWQRIYDSMRTVMDGISLQDMLEDSGNLRVSAGKEGN